MFTFCVVTHGFSQMVNLSDHKSVKEFLNKKEFKVGDYGKIKFTFLKYDKDFGSLQFNVLYTINTQSKPIKKLMQCDVFVESNSFVLPNFMRGITLRNGSSMKMLNINAPSNFQLFENGELYYQDRAEIDMDEYIENITSGKYSLGAAPYKLCK